MVQLFSNPRSGGHSARRIAALARAFERLGAEVLASETGDGIPRIAPRATHVCVAAGDGTVRHVAGAVARSGHPVPLSIYPVGTINLLAREAGHPTDPGQFAALVLGGASRRPHYPVAIGDGHFFASAGVGPDSLAVDRVSERLKRRIGRLAYGVAVVRLLAAWPRHRIALDADGRRLDCEAFYVAKGRYYAGPWSFAPGAAVGEPELHVVALITARRRDYARFVLRLALGRRPRAGRGVAILTCRALSARSQAPLPVQADGDIVAALPVTMTVSEVPVMFS